MDAIIIAGGKGSRMDAAVPKPLVSVRGKPILAHQLERLLSHPLINAIILSLGYGADEIRTYIQGHYSSAPILFSVEQQPLGTAGGLARALEHCTAERILVLNCDDILDLDIASFTKGTEQKICVAHPRLHFGRVHEKDGYAVFEEKPLSADWASCGWYCFNKSEILPYLPHEGSLEYDVFPHIKLRVYKYEGHWRVLNTKKDLAEFESGA